MMNYDLRFSDSMEITTVQEKNPVRDGILVATGFNPWIRLYDGKRAPCSNYFYQLLFWRAFQHPDQRNAFRVKLLVVELELSTRPFFILFNPENSGLRQIITTGFFKACFTTYCK